MDKHRYRKDLLVHVCAIELIISKWEVNCAAARVLHAEFHNAD